MNKKKLSVVILCLIMLFSLNSLSLATSTINNTSNKIETKSVVIKWLYKLIQGKLYKIKYNFNTGKTEGNWILVS